MKKEKDFEKFRDSFECLGCTYKLYLNAIEISDRWALKIIIPLTQRSFSFTIESIDEGKDMSISNSMWSALNEIAKEYNK